MPPIRGPYPHRTSAQDEHPGEPRLSRAFRVPTSAPALTPTPAPVPNHARRRPGDAGSAARTSGFFPRRTPGRPAVLVLLDEANAPGPARAPALTVAPDEQ